MTGWLAFLRRDILAAGAALVLAAAVLAATIGPSIVPFDPLAVNLGANYQPSSWRHPLGTDHLGRDTLSRLVAGARVSLGIALAATGAGLLIGAIIGLVAAWRRGLIELAAMQGVDVLLALPELLLAITAITVLGRGTISTVVAVAIYAVPSFARIVRAAAQPIVGADYVTAARAAGASDLRVLRRHVLPGCASPMLAHATVMLGSAILLASGLSFLGLGVQPPEAEWGSMLSRGRDLLQDGAARRGGAGRGDHRHGAQLLAARGRPARRASPGPLARQLTARWAIALKRWRSESGLAGELCVISTMAVRFTGSTQKIVPAVPSQPYSPRLAPVLPGSSTHVDVGQSPAHRAAARGLDLGGQTVGRHAIDGLGLQHAHPGQGAAVEQHLAEAQVVGDGGHQAHRAFEQRRLLGERHGLDLDWRQPPAPPAAGP